ncbi:PREDICTED: membrane-bound alkaline phosphatase [Drosophila arizonae]|uniref:alkaline phosphatase n=1 Tax=Drosophila arizonae TaxID=7263 RepID=A0ABM1P5M5_DROAR|nr:PREDICTED: membrane-bound alkaline phosphatase [Drosophila arizonae]
MVKGLASFYLAGCLLALALVTCPARADLSDEQENEQHPRMAASRDYVELDEERNSRFWVNKAQSILADKLSIHKQLNENRAKNIILFLGDGMSVHTIAATRAFMGDSNKQVYFEKFPYVGLSKTYAVDERTPDSASTATAYLTGVKGNYGTIGVNAKVKRGSCKAATDKATHTESIAQWAQEAGKWAGVVTTARVTHASPAGTYAHVADRDWEHDGKVTSAGCSADDNVDIARQLVEWPVGRDLRVVLGGGRAYFRDKSMKDEEGFAGKRKDGRDLIKDWQQDKANQGAEAKYVWSRNGLHDVDLSRTDYLLGLFDVSHCPYHTERTDVAPSLSEMTEAAIKLLSRNEEGYFLFVEGGRIDMAHHDTKARKALEETEEFARAVELARDLTSDEDTLIVVTSDHSHTMTINGYPYRRQNILSLAPNLADDEKPFTILSYANGPGFVNTYDDHGRMDLSNADTEDADFQFQATVPLKSETHGGEDVAVFASGPHEHFFSGNYEQTTIPALMAYAANIGPFAKDKLNK